EDKAGAHQGAVGNQYLGVEAGQLLSLLVIVTLVNIWRGAATFRTQALVANGALMSAGFVFVFYQLTGYYLY
ncbi:MAG: HupE/UreJ family protein, partial [Pseudomonadales bacterium]